MLQHDGEQQIDLGPNFSGAFCLGDLRNGMSKSQPSRDEQSHRD